MCNKIQANTTTCPFCGLECGSHPRLIAHMIACAASSRCNGRMPGGNGHGRVNWNSGKLVAAVAAGFIAVSLFVSAPVKAQTVPQPQPTPSISTPPQQPRLWLPYISTTETVNGCSGCGNSTDGRYWGGQQQTVSWRPTGDAKI